jgi:hypothetical protein
MMTATYGEQHIDSLLKRLVNHRKDLFYVAEPAIKADKSAHIHPDFVIVSAKQGVIVLEVKDWINILEADQRNIVIKRRDGHQATEKNPIQTAKEYAYNLNAAFRRVDELLKKRHGRIELKFPWMYGVAFPNIESKIIQRLMNENIWGDGFAFGRNELTEDRFESCLATIPSRWKLESPLTNEIREKIRGVLDPRVILPDNTGIETLRQTNIIIEPLKTQTPANTLKQATLLPDDFLTKEAAELAENVTVRLVRGVAGSGKSLVLARRAQYLAEQYPHLRILVMAFNTDLTADLQRRIPGAPNLEIQNFHKICRSIISRRISGDIISIDRWLEHNMGHYLQSNQFSAEFVAQEIEWRKELGIYDSQEYLTVARDGRGKALGQDKRAIINQIFDQYMHTHHTQSLIDWTDVPHLAFAELQQGHPLRASYDVILIDEAQDFAPSWLKVVNKLLKPDGTLFMCDDPTQSLFRSFSWRQKGVEVVGRTRLLRVPFRCTKEITQAAHSLIKGDSLLGHSEDITEPDLSSYELASGNPPSLVKSYDIEQEIALVEQLAYSISRTGVSPEQIAVLCHSKRIVKHWAHMRNKGYYVETFNKMKGLEFYAVFVPHLNTAFDQYDTPKDDTFVSETRRRIYTAMTRARDTLVLSYHGTLPQELKLIQPYVQMMDG